MSIFIILFLTAVISYLIGSLNFAIIISKLLKKPDIRTQGSKNAGMTNMIRSYGVKIGVLVFLGDFIKGFLAVRVSSLLFHSFPKFNTYAILISSLCVVVGHIFPIYFKFHGGKGSSTTAGVALAQDIRFFLISISVFLIILLIFKIVAVASVLAAVSYPISTLIFFHNYLVFIFSIIISLFVIYSHRSNIKKLFY